MSPWVQRRMTLATALVVVSSALWKNSASDFSIDIKAIPTLVVILVLLVCIDSVCYCAPAHLCVEICSHVGVYWEYLLLCTGAPLYGDLIMCWCALRVFVIVHRSTCIWRYAHRLMCIDSVCYCAQEHLCMEICSHAGVHWEWLLCAQEHLCMEICSHAGTCTKEGLWSTSGSHWSLPSLFNIGSHTEPDLRSQMSNEF